MGYACADLSACVHVCVWDFVFVFDQPGLVQAQNDPLSPEALVELGQRFSELPRTFGWPGKIQHRFVGKDQALLIWNGENQADWWVGARDAESLESDLRTIWSIDGVGQSFYDCSEIGRVVLDRLMGET